MTSNPMWKCFSEVDLSDSFFDSLKQDYKEFSEWFQRKSKEGAQALVSTDDLGITSFLYLKKEAEAIELAGAEALPEKQRLKIGTFKLSDRIQGSRQGEGTLGIALWRWRDEKAEEIYVTVFDKHGDLITLLSRFGFHLAGRNKRGEGIYVKSRKCLDYGDPYKSFPFVRPDFEHAYVLPIDDNYHDQLFPYSTLLRNQLDVEQITAGNGVSKVFIGFPSYGLSYKEDSPILVYRKHTGSLTRRYASAITSYCMLTDVKWVKREGKACMDFAKFASEAGNKTVFSRDELGQFYQKRNVVMVGLLYLGYFGERKNVAFDWLDNNGLVWEGHPYQAEYAKSQFLSILEKGGIDVQNVVVN